MKKEKKIIKDVERGIKWDLKTGKYKNLSEILEDCKAAYKMFGGGGYYGLNYKDLINYLEAKIESEARK